MGPLGRVRPDHERRVRPQARRRRPTPREEAGDAAEYYADKFRTIFKEAGEGVGKAGDKAGEAADKLSDWLKQR